MNTSKFDFYAMQSGRNNKKENRINIDRDEHYESIQFSWKKWHLTNLPDFFKEVI